MSTTTKTGRPIGADVYAYASRTAYWAVQGVAGADPEDIRQAIICGLWERGADLSALDVETDGRTARSLIMWEGRTLRSRAIDAARLMGEEPSERAAADGLMSGTLAPTVHVLDVIDAAWRALARDDVDAYRLAVWASYAAIGRGGVPATGAVLPIVDRADRETRGARVRAALGMLGDMVADMVADLRAVGFAVQTERAGIGSPTARTVPLIDTAQMIRRYGATWDDDAREGVRAVTGTLSRADMRGLFRHDVNGPAGSTVPARVARASERTPRVERERPEISPESAARIAASRAYRESLHLLS